MIKNEHHRNCSLSQSLFTGCWKCQPIRNALDVTMELSKLILYSPKRTVVFQSCRQELSPTGLHPLCPTRWTVSIEAINTLLKNYAAIVQALEQSSDESHDDYGWRANGLLSQLKRELTVESHLVFSGTEQTSICKEKIHQFKKLLLVLN